MKVRIANDELRMRRAQMASVNSQFIIRNANSCALLR